jgi:DNA-binding NarL/FixJ family response regulator
LGQKSLAEISASGGAQAPMITAEQAVLYPMFVKVADSVRLTNRKIHIATLLASGKSGKEVADHLNLSTKTVETHRALIYRTLGIHSITELTLYAIREGWVKVV